MACGVYMIKHKNTGQMYIGQSIDIEKRFKQHCESTRDLTNKEVMYVSN